MDDHGWSEYCVATRQLDLRASFSFGICLIMNPYLHPYGCSISLNLQQVNSGQILVFGEQSMQALVSWQILQDDQSSENDQIHFNLLDNFNH